MSDDTLLSQKDIDALLKTVGDPDPDSEVKRLEKKVKELNERINIMATAFVDLANEFRYDGPKAKLHGTSYEVRQLADEMLEWDKEHNPVDQLEYIYMIEQLGITRK